MVPTIKERPTRKIKKLKKKFGPLNQKDLITLSYGAKLLSGHFYNTYKLYFILG